MAGPVTDPELLKQLEGGGAPAPVNDPKLLSKLEDVDSRSVTDFLPSLATVKDVAKSAGSGLLRGVVSLPGAVADTANAVDHGWQWLMSEGLGLVGALTPEQVKGIRQPLPGIENQPTRMGMPTGETLTKAFEGATGREFHKPTTTAGRIVDATTAALPGIAATGPGTIGSAVRFGLAPAAASEAAGQLTQGSEYEGAARVAAALLAPAALSAGQKLISPASGNISPARQQAADVLRAEGVEPTAGQLTGSRALRYAESELGGGRAADAMEQQGQAFTRAAVRRMGQDGIADPQTFTEARDRLGRQYDELSARNTIAPDQQLGQDLRQVYDGHTRLLDAQQKPVIQNYIGDIVEKFRANGGAMPGEMYQAIRSELTTAARGAQGQFQEALRGIRNSLDDAMDRSVSPEDSALWRQTNREYTMMKTLEKAALGGGEASAAGIISPAKLRQAASTGRTGNYIRGEGDLDELARSGQAILTPLPDSGTAGRTAVRNLGGGLLSALGAGAGFSTGGGPAAGMTGAAIGAAVPKVAGALLMSQPGQAYLKNQLVPQTRMMDPRMLAVINALQQRQEQ